MYGNKLADKAPTFICPPTQEKDGDGGRNKSIKLADKKNNKLQQRLAS